jgi:hypothetical protein
VSPLIAQFDGAFVFHHCVIALDPASEGIV